jgi:hypothetical protein
MPKKALIDKIELEELKKNNKILREQNMALGEENQRLHGHIRGLAANAAARSSTRYGANNAALTPSSAAQWGETVMGTVNSHPSGPQAGQLLGKLIAPKPQPSPQAPAISSADTTPTNGFINGHPTTGMLRPSTAVPFPVIAATPTQTPSQLTGGFITPPRPPPVPIGQIISPDPPPNIPNMSPITGGTPYNSSNAWLGMQILQQQLDDAVEDLNTTIGQRTVVSHIHSLPFSLAHAHPPSPPLLPLHVQHTDTFIQLWETCLAFAADESKLATELERSKQHIANIVEKISELEERNLQVVKDKQAMLLRMQDVERRVREAQSMGGPDVGMYMDVNANSW